MIPRVARSASSAVTRNGARGSRCCRLLAPVSAAQCSLATAAQEQRCSLKGKGCKRTAYPKIHGGTSPRADRATDGADVGLLHSFSTTPRQRLGQSSAEYSSVERGDDGDWETKLDSPNKQNRDTDLGGPRFVSGSRFQRPRRRGRFSGTEYSGQRGGRNGRNGASSEQRSAAWSTTERDYVSTMQELKRVSDWPEVIEKYNQSVGEPGFSKVMFNVTIGTLSRSPLWQQALSVFRDMKVAGHSPDAYAFNSAILACTSGNDKEKAFALFDEMPEAGIAPDVYTYNYLITVCKKDSWETALSLMREMETVGLRPGSMTYNAVIVALGNGGQADTAMDMLQIMRDQEVQLTEGTYSAAIAACGKAQHWERALELLEEMKAGSDNLTPNEFCYNAAIGACARSARWQEAIGLLRDMQANEVTCRPRVYSQVIKACVNAGREHEAEILLDEMRASGMFVKSKTLKLVATRGEERREFAPTTMQALYDPDEAQANTSLTPLRAVTSAAGQRPRARAALRTFLRRMHEHANAERWSEITRELNEVVANPDVKVSMRVYEGCIDALGKGGRCAEAIGVLEKIRSAGLTPNSKCVTAAIRACGRGEPPRWATAMALLEDMEKPDVWAHVATLSVLAKAKQWKTSLSMLDGMRPSGIVPNVYAYNSVLVALRRADPPQWEKARALLAQMIDEGLTPAPWSYSQVVEACVEASQPAAATSVMADMIEAGCPPAEELKSLVASASSSS